jgi:arylsulfatase
MSDSDSLDVLISVYLIPELAKRDFDAFVQGVEDGKIDTNGIVLVSKDADGELTVEETGDHLGKKGAKVGGGVGLVLGLFAPPLLAATAVGAGLGAVAGKFARKRLEAGVGEKMDESLPPGSAGIIAIYEQEDAAEVEKALSNSIRKSVAQIDKASAKELKAGLEEASAGLAG